MGLPLRANHPHFSRATGIGSSFFVLTTPEMRLMECNLNPVYQEPEFEVVPTGGIVVPLQKALTHDQFWKLFQQGFPGWDHRNGDTYLVNHAKLRGEQDQIVAWLATNCTGCFLVAGSFPHVLEVIFQYEGDMETARRRFE
jgi:hypothetical protein